MSDLIFEDLPTIESEKRFVVGFRMRKKKNWKYGHVSLYKITNQAHDEYGNYVIMSHGFANEIFDFYEEGKARAIELLEIKRQEFVSGRRNWWSGEITE